MSFNLRTLSVALLLASTGAQASDYSNTNITYGQVKQMAEPGVEFYYFPAGNDNGQTTFDMSFAIHDPKIEDAYYGVFSNLKVEIEYEALKDLGTSHRTEIVEPKALKSVGTALFGEITLSGLSEATMYRARIRFYNTALDAEPVLVGAPSDWYYTVTEGSSQASRLRTKLLLQGIYENHENGTMEESIEEQYSTLCSETSKKSCANYLLEQESISNQDLEPIFIAPDLQRPLFSQNMLR